MLGVDGIVGLLTYRPCCTPPDASCTPSYSLALSPECAVCSEGTLALSRTSHGLRKGDVHEVEGREQESARRLSVSGVVRQLVYWSCCTAVPLHPSRRMLSGHSRAILDQAMIYQQPDSMEVSSVRVHHCRSHCASSPAIIVRKCEPCPSFNFWTARARGVSTPGPHCPTVGPCKLP